MSGMEPILIGSALGAAMNRRNPLQGAMLGGVLGGFGGAAMGAANPAATATMTGATMPTAGTGVAASTPIASFGTGSLATPTMPVYAATGGSTGLIPSMTAPVTMMDRLGAMGSFAKENPMAVGIGLQSANSLLAQQPPTPMAPPPGLMRGQQFQTEQPQMAMFHPPQISLI